MIKDPEIDKLWEAAKEDQAYQSTAKIVADKVKRATLMSMSNHPLKQYQQVMERLSVVKKANTRLMMKDHTQVVVPEKLISKMLRREHISHAGRNKMDASIRVK